MSDRERDEKGRFTSKKHIEKNEILSVVEEYEPASTREVADVVGIPRRSALRYLDDLSDEGTVKKKKLDPRRVVWTRDDPL